MSLVIQDKNMRDYNRGGQRCSRRRFEAMYRRGGEAALSWICVSSIDLEGAEVALHQSRSTVHGVADRRESAFISQELDSMKADPLTAY